MSKKTRTPRSTRQYDAMRIYKPSAYAQETARAYRYRKRRKTTLAGVLVYMAVEKKRKR